MGFELDRLMRQYGVSTPTMQRYAGASATTGAAPVAPTELVAPTLREMPVVGAAPKDPGRKATPEQQAAYQTALGAYNAARTDLDLWKTEKKAYDPLKKAYDAALPKYNTDLAAYNTAKSAYDTANANYAADQANYNAYTTDYRNRLMNTPMYLQAQFNTRPTAPAPVTPVGNRDDTNGFIERERRLNQEITPLPQIRPPGTATADITNLYQRYLQREPDEAGLANWQRQFGEEVSPQERQGFIAAARPEMQERGLNQFGRQFYEDTGSYYGNQLQAPVFLGTPSTSNSAVATGSGPTGQNLEFRSGVRGYYLPSGQFAAPVSTGVGGLPGVAGGTPPILPKGLPAGALYDNTRKTYFVPYAQGGAVKGYAKGDLVDLEQKYANPTNLPEIMTFPLPPQEQIQMNRIVDAAPPPPMVTAGMPGAAGDPSGAAPVRLESAPPKPAGNNDLLSMIERYMPTTDYSTELQAARTKVAGKSEAFANMLKNAMAEETAPSREEMYWRLAAAFGSPTKTGAFSENLSLAGKEMAEYRKAETEAKRANRAAKLQLGLKGAELDLAGAKEDLDTLRQLQQEGMKDKRTIAAELVKQYVKSGEPESSAGKQAKDEGLKPNTPQFQARVKEIAQANVDAQTSRIDALLANVSVTQANLLLNQQKLQMEIEKSKKLTPGEVKLKSDTEDLIGNADQALDMLRQAYKLNPNTFDTTLTDVAQRKLLENTSSNDPKVKSTRLMENLLAKDALAKLKASFGANPTEGERKVILELEGIGAKSKEERSAIMLSAFEALKKSLARYQKRLNEINQGLYRETNTEGIQ